MSEHQCFTVGATNYFRNHSREELNAPCIAVHFENEPTVLPGSGQLVNVSLIFPMLIVASYVDDQIEVAQRVAAILNDHWNDPKYANAGAVQEKSDG